MAAKKADTVPLAEGETPRPRLHKLVIKNFRSIGPKPVEVELDDIVVLVGPNNSGKSTVLRAYETVMSHGSKEGKLTIDDFPRGIVDAANLPEVQLETIVFNNAPGDRWIAENGQGEWLIRERWTWDSPNKDPIRQGFNVQKNDWDDQVPWGAPNIANARRPRPHRIDAFEPPDVQAAEIAKLITATLKDKVAALKSNPAQEKSDYDLVLDKIRDLQTRAVQATEKEIVAIEDELSNFVNRIFPNHRVKFDSRAETDLEKAYTPFKAEATLRMGPQDGFFSTVAHQGSGARRTLLWAALKYVSEAKEAKAERPHLLLLDEPEICLHPAAIREARTVLYGLPASGNWQVMITSHSPIFIDLSLDNTTVVRVDRNHNSAVQSTTLFRPKRAKLSNDDKKNMKLLNICDPYLHEFFFGGRQVVVEGDTEHTAFGIIRQHFPEEYSDVHIIRARGKGIIPSVARVLLQFSKEFAILHDTDTEKTKAGKNNPAWGMNKSIEEIQSWPNADNVELIACKTSFEVAMFGDEVKSEKPYNALKRLQDEDDARLKAKALLDSLLDSKRAPPDGCIRWTKVHELA